MDMESIKTFTRERDSTSNSGPKSPYLTFTLGPGALRRLVVKVWVTGEKPALLLSKDESTKGDTRSQASITLAFGLLDKGLSSNGNNYGDLIEFRANLLGSNDVKCYVAGWKVGAPLNDDDCDDIDIQALLESLTEAESWDIGVFVTAGTSSIHRMDIEVRCNPIQDTLREISSQSKSHSSEMETFTALHGATSSPSTGGSFCGDDSALVPRGYCPQWPYFLQGVSSWLSRRFETTEMISDINHAIRIGQKAVSLTAQGHLTRAIRLDSLGISLCLRFQHKGSMEDLDAAIKLGQEVLDCFRNHPIDPGFLNNLALRLGLRSQRTGSLEDIDHAIDLLSRAVDMPQRLSKRLGQLINLGNWLGSRFLAKGLESDLNRAIEVSETAVNGTSHSDPLRTTRLTNLTNWLGTRFMHNGSTNDLDLAIRLLREELDSGHGPMNFSRSTLLNNLGIWLSRSFQRSGLIQQLNEGIEAAEVAVNIAPIDHPNRADWLSNLGSWLSFRFQHTGQPEDLQRGIELLTTVVDMTSSNHNTRHPSAANLGILLGLRFQRTNSKVDLNRSIKLLSSVVEETPHDHPDRARMMNNLGNWYGERYRLSGSEVDLLRQISCFSEGSHAPNSAPSVRIRLARNAASLLANQSMWQDAATLLHRAVNLLQAVSPRALQQTDKQYMLSSSSGLATFAAAATLNAGGDAEAALKLLEVGRGVIAGLLLETRAEVAELKHGHLALSEEFESIRDLLDSPSSETSFSAPGTPVLSWGPRRELEARFHAVVDKIRNQPGFGNFLLPPTTEQLHAAASSGPIIVVNYTQYRSDAFIITSQVIRTIPLDLSTLPEVGDEIRITDSLLERLWDSIAGSVLNELGFSESLANMQEQEWPRMWWILTGSLSRLPIHAAGRYLTNPAETVLDRVISSYSTSIKGLIYARETSAKKGAQKVPHDALFVSMQETPSHNGLVPCDLQFAEEEIGLVDSILNPSVSRTVMAQPTRGEVLRAVETCTIFHFAGHGISDPQDPSSSCLLLSDWADHPLTVQHLTELKLFTKSPWLAYLSACSTGESKAENLQDEALHLVSSCQLAGFSHVIGSLWRIDDECSADAARHVYETMQSGGWTDRAVALGVHHAARFLRRKTGQREWLATRGRYHADWIQSEEMELVDDLHANQGRGEGSAKARGFGYAGRSGGDPSIWAAYIHVGP